MLVVELAPKGEKHRGTLIWLHGLGDSSDGFRPLFEQVAPQVSQSISCTLNLLQDERDQSRAT